MKRFQSLITYSALLLYGSLAFGQQPGSGQVHIKVDANVNGKTVKIDTSVDAVSDFDLNGLLDDLDLTDELGQMNIDINSNNHFNWDDSALHSMMEGLQNIQMPELPDMSSFSFSGENKAMLGVYTDTDPLGAKITSILEGSAAEEAGLKEGDIITKIDDRTIESSNNLMEVIGKYEPGAPVTITYLRDGKESTASVVLKESDNSFSWSGNFDLPDSFNLNFGDGDIAQLFNMQDEHRGYLGVYLDDQNEAATVTGVESGSAAEKAGLQKGDIITGINGNTVKGYDAVIEQMKNTQPGDKIRIDYLRNGKKENTDAVLDDMNGAFNFNSDDSYTPNIIIDKVLPCQPGSAYSYQSSDGGKSINICITTNAGKDSDAKTESASSSLLDPAQVKVFSNPSDGTFQISFNLAEEGDTRITVTDVDGKQVYTEILKNFSGAYDKTVSLPDAPKGTYFVKVSQGGYSCTKTVIVQ